ncbi:protein KRTCAP2 homolog [Oscarella lobularis]|uniref:protein KRTCAP2 homolog n=1 Tax=Oscarella lobularis TaxID=121494 RepID=UPI0033137357
MATSSSTSFILSVLLAVITFACMQIYRGPLSSNQGMTILGGFVGSILFILLITAVGNLETMAFGREYSTGLFPEVISCLLLSTLVSGFAIHRVCATVCLLFSIGHIYVMNRLSASKYGPAPGSAQLVATKPKRKN